MNAKHVLFLGLFSSLPMGFDAFAAEENVATVVYAKIGNGYKREKAKDGSFKPEYYALSNGGRIAGTTSDLTIDRVTYAEVAEIAMKLLTKQNYRYAQTKEQAKLLLLLNWGATLVPNWDRKNANIAQTQMELQNFERTKQDLKSKLEREGAVPSYPGEDRVANTANGFGRGILYASNEEAAITNAAGSLANSIESSLTDDRVRDKLNEANARVLGYMDELADSNDVRRYAGGGNRYNDLIEEVEEGRYYVVISAYDFVELTKKGKKKLLWQTRVSVRGPGNSFDSTVAAMLKSASKYFGQDSGRLVRGEESKGSVEMKDLKFLGEAKKPAAKTKTPEPATKAPEPAAKTPEPAAKAPEPAPAK